MPKNILTLFLSIFFSITAFSQEKFTLSGIISDGSNKETLIGVSVFVEETKTGTVTNEYGFYSITLPKGDYTVSISYVGYQNSSEKISLNQNIKKNFLLSESSKVLDEVVIIDNKKRIDIRKPEMSVNKLTIQEIKEMPVIFGPNFKAFPEAHFLVENGGGFSIKNLKDWQLILEKLMDPEDRHKVGLIASSYIVQNMGTVDKILPYISEVLHYDS